jgi:small subunit ribosomal protein S5
VVGDGKGRVGAALGKANTVPAAIQKGQEKAKREMFDVPMRNTTIPHGVVGKFESSEVMLKPASEGTGVIAGGGVRAVMELAGIRDVLTKALGSTTSVNLVKATVEGLKQLRSKAAIEQARGSEDHAMSPLKVTQMKERHRLHREPQTHGAGAGSQADPGPEGTRRYAPDTRYDPQGQAPGARGGG